MGQHYPRLLITPVHWIEICINYWHIAAVVALSMQYSVQLALAVLIGNRCLYITPLSQRGGVSQPAGRLHALPSSLGGCTCGALPSWSVRSLDITCPSASLDGQIDIPPPEHLGCCATLGWR